MTRYYLYTARNVYDESPEASIPVEFSAASDAEAEKHARRLLRTRGLWTFRLQSQHHDRRVVQAWNLDNPSYGDRSRVAHLEADL